MNAICARKSPATTATTPMGRRVTSGALVARSVEYLLVSQIFKQWTERVRRSKDAQYGLFFTATGIRGAV